MEWAKLPKVELHKTFGWDAQHFLRCNTDALIAAFVPEDVRGKLLARLVESYQSAL